MKKAVLFFIIPVMLLLSGCGTFGKTVLHPIEGSHIFSIEKGDKVVKRDGTEIEVERNGWFLSDFYMAEVSDTKVE